MTVRRFRLGHGSLGGIPRGVPPQRWKLRDLWKIQDLRRRVRKDGAGPQVSVAFKTASLSAASTYTMSANAPDKLAVSKATATCGSVPAFGKQRRSAWAFHRDLICHGWGGTPIGIPPRLPWLWLEDAKRAKKTEKGQNDRRKDKRWRSLGNAI